METPTPSAAPQKEKKSRDLMYIIIIIILTATCGLFGYFLSQQKIQIETIEKEKVVFVEKAEDLQAELSELKHEYENLQTNDKKLQEELNGKIRMIDSLQVLAQKHKNDAYEIRKLKKEATTLRDIMIGYVHTIDSLNTLNIVLREEKKGVEKELGHQKEKYTSLEKEKEGLSEKVKIGSRLKTKSIVAAPQKIKSNNEHRETNRAKNVDVFKCCFMLDKNEIAKPGVRDVYMRAITPEGKVIADSNDEEHQFSFNGVRGLFSMKKEVDYQNQEMEVCMYLNIKSQISAGEYIIELYTEEAEIGRTRFKLK